MKEYKNLTLLLPVYNGGEDLSGILKSLEDLNGRTNVIIYNDGSVDNSYEVACDFADKSKHTVRVIDGKKNRGYFRTIKILLRVCPTNFFMFLGHDDLLSNNYLDEFDAITAELSDVACIYTDIATITPEGAVTNTWPNSFRKDGVPNKISGSEIVKTFHKHEWGNLFVAIWSKQVLSHTTLLQIMRSVPNSLLTLPLKKSGFLNDNMAIVRALSYNTSSLIIHKKIGVYFKKVDPKRLSEGGAHFKKDKVLHNPLGYLAIAAHFMLPQIKQTRIATIWMFRYLYIYLGISAKALFRSPGSIDIRTFFQGVRLILTGYATNILVARRRSS